MVEKTTLDAIFETSSEELVGCSTVILYNMSEYTDKAYKFCDPNRITPPSLNSYGEEIINSTKDNNIQTTYMSYDKTTNNNICKTEISLYYGTSNISRNSYIKDPECSAIVDQYSHSDLVKIVYEGIYPELEQQARVDRKNAQVEAPEQYWYSDKINKCLKTGKDSNNNRIIIDVKPGECPAQFTNVKSGRKSRKIERFESNNNLKCKARY